MEQLKKTVLEANLALFECGLVLFTWGNVSEIDRKRGLVAIKPSGVRYQDMTADDIVVVDMDGKTVEGRLKPSSDLATHLEIYQAFPKAGGVVHTHSTCATSFAQACRGIPAFGTTHADYFFGEIPLTRGLTDAEIQEDYEKNTGKVIAERFSGMDAMAVPGVLVREHGPFAWGKDANEAVYHAAVMEEVAKMALNTLLLGHEETVDSAILNKHYSRKHGSNAYYGQ